MKVILLKDVSGVGQHGTIAEVSDGHALNLLIPRGLAVQATPDKIAKHAAQVKENDSNKKVRDLEWAAQIKKITGRTVTVRAKANAQGHLYKQLSTAHIAGAIQTETGIDVPMQAIKTTSPIKTIGDAEATVTLGTQSAHIIIRTEKED